MCAVCHSIGIFSSVLRCGTITYMRMYALSTSILIFFLGIMSPVNFFMMHEDHQGSAMAWIGGAAIMQPNVPSSAEEDCLQHCMRSAPLALTEWAIFSQDSLINIGLFAVLVCGWWYALALYARGLSVHRWRTINCFNLRFVTSTILRN